MSRRSPSKEIDEAAKEFCARHKVDPSPVKAWLVLWLMTAILVSGLNSVQPVVAATSPAGNDSVDITDLGVELEGYHGVIWAYTYDGWRAYLESIGIPHGDDYLFGRYSYHDPRYRYDIDTVPHYIPPQNFLLLRYNNTESGRVVYVEIYEYNSTEDAANQYGSQYGEDESRFALIFRRFNAVQVLLHRGQFMVFIFCPTEQPATDAQAQSTLTDCTQKFVDNLFNVLPESTQPSAPPSVDFAGKVVWGVKAGDTISWELNVTRFTGYVGGGISHSEGSYTIAMEIVQITDDNLAILIRSPESHPSDFDYSAYELPNSYGLCGLNLVLPAYRYFWATVTDPAKDPHANAPCSLIFPIYSEGRTLKDVIKSSEGLKDVTEGAEYITGHYKTAPAEDYTPIETRWEDVTVHKGSGIVTRASSYYNNNEYSITSSHSLTLENTNFDLSSRVPPLKVREGVVAVSLALAALSCCALPQISRITMIRRRREMGRAAKS